MSEDDKVVESSNIMSNVLTPVTLEKTPGTAKVFILTPEILQKLSLAGHMTARIASQDIVKKEDTSIAQEARENLDQESRKSYNTISRVVEQTAASNRRKRENISMQNAVEMQETLKPCISMQLEERLNGTKQEIPVESTKSEEDSWLKSKTKKRKRRSNALLDGESQNLNNETDKKSKDKLKMSVNSLYCLPVSQSTTNVDKAEFKDVCEKPTSKEKSTPERIRLKEARNSRKTVETEKLTISRTTSSDSTDKISFSVPQSSTNISSKESLKILEMYEKLKPKEKSSEDRVGFKDVKEEKEGLEATLVQNDSEDKTSLFTEETGCTAFEAPSNIDKQGFYEFCQSREQIAIVISELQHETQREEDIEAVAFMQGNTEAEKSLFTEEIGFAGPQGQITTIKKEFELNPAGTWNEEDEIRSTENVEAIDFMQGNSEAEQSLFAEESRFTESCKREFCKTYVKRKLKEKTFAQDEEKKLIEGIDAVTLKHEILEAENSSSPDSTRFDVPQSSTVREMGFRKTYEKHKPKEKSTMEKVVAKRKSKVDIEIPAAVQGNSGTKSDASIETLFSTVSLDRSVSQKNALPHKINESSTKNTKTPRSSSKNKEGRASKSKTPRNASKKGKAVEKNAKPVPLLLPDKKNEEDVCDENADPSMTLIKKEIDFSKSELDSLICTDKNEENSSLKVNRGMMPVDKELETPRSPDKNETIVSNLESPKFPDKKHEACASELEFPMDPVKKEKVCAWEIESSWSRDENEEFNVSEMKISRSSDTEETYETNLLTNEIPAPANNFNSHANTDLSLMSEISSNVEITNTSSANNSSNIDAMQVDKSIPAKIIPSEEPRIPRKRGRPRKTAILPKLKVELEPNLQKVQNTTIESPIGTLASNDTPAYSTCRTKRPVQRYVDETDGKGLSEGSEDDNAAFVVKPVKRRGRPPGIMSKSWTGGSKPRRGKGRGRGRGRGQSRGSTVDSDYMPRIVSAPSKRNEYETYSGVNPQEPETTSEIECAKCKIQMLKEEWPRHNTTKHNGMGWLTGTEELDFKNNVKLLRSILMAVLKKKSMLVCETCGTAKRSANGFISHLQFCGKTDEERLSLLVTCPICNNVMMPSSMEMHERSHRQVDKSKYEREWEETVDAQDAPSSKGKRKAAEKAATKISEFTELVKEDRCPEDDLCDLVKKPRCITAPPPRWKSIWKKELATNGKAFCRQPVCQFTGDSMEAMYKHNAVCPFTPRPMFLCKICNFSSEIEETVNNHVRDKHWDGKPDSGSEDDSSFSDGDNEIQLNVQTPKKEFDKYRPQSTGVKFVDDETSIHPNWAVCYPPAFRWTMEFESKNYSLRLFEDFLPRSMNLLDYETSLEYLPQLSRSMQVKIMEKHADKEPADWIRWERFQGSVNKGVPSLFTGGPVWALAWLPIPVPMCDLAVDQYVAISTHPSMESTYSIGSSYAGKNIIQIWNMGHLDHSKNAALQAPEFSYGVAHDKGTVWCLEWCPSGCYEHERFHENSTEKTMKAKANKKRMGLLAAACSDGCVHIFSLPFPEEKNVKQENVSSNNRPIYETKPVLTLTVSASRYERGEQNWQCTCLNWSKSLGHDTIIAGFSNGFVALWDPTTTSQLSINSRGETTMIDAFHHFYAHGHALSSVQMVPFEGKRFFYTTSYDRLTKLWDMEDLSFTVGTAKRGIVTAGSLFTNWAAYVTAYDDAYGLANTHTYLMSLRQPGTKILPLLPTKSTIYSVATSDYGNSIGQGTLAGEVLVMFPHQLWSYKDMERDVPKKRWLASTVRIVDFKANEDSNSIKNNAKRKTMEKEYTYKPETYDECEDRFGMVFRDELTRSRRDIHKRRCKPSFADRLSTFNIEEYPFASVNRVSWNPNAWSYLWLCVGYQNGLVRFLNFNTVADDRKLHKLLPSHANSMLERARSSKTNIARDVNEDNENDTEAKS